MTGQYTTGFQVGRQLHRSDDWEDHQKLRAEELVASLVKFLNYGDGLEWVNESWQGPTMRQRRDSRRGAFVVTR